MQPITLLVIRLFDAQAVYSYFNIPFLRLQRRTLEAQIERNAVEMENSLLELDAISRCSACARVDVVASGDKGGFFFFFFFPLLW